MFVHGLQVKHRQGGIKRQAFMNASGGLHHLTDRQAHAFPAVVLDLKLFAPRFREPVILGPAIILGLAPFRFDPAPVLQAVERRVKRTFADAQHVVRPLLNALTDAEAMRRFAAQNFQDEHVQRALEKIGFLHNRCLVLSDVDGRLAVLLSNVNRRAVKEGYV